MFKKINLSLLLAGIFFLMSWLLTGIYYDDEFMEPAMFLKHRPTFKVVFNSPIGMQDLELKDLDSEKQTEELAFQEFVIEQDRLYSDNEVLWVVPLLLIQLTLTFFVFGVYRLFGGVTIKLRHYAIHFIFSAFFTVFGIGFILIYDHLGVGVLIAALVLFMNGVTYWMMKRVLKRFFEHAA